MGDGYVECLIKQQKKGWAKLAKYLLIGLAVVFAVVFVMFIVTNLGIIALIAAVLCGVGAYVLSYFTTLEYEYLYLDKELTIDEIRSQSSRKRRCVINLEQMEIFAPYHSYKLDNYRNRPVKDIDYSIGYEEKPDKRYIMFADGGKKYILSPSEELVAAMRNAAPRKVFTE